MNVHFRTQIPCICSASDRLIAESDVQSGRLFVWTVPGEKNWTVQKDQTGLSKSMQMDG